MQFVGPLFLTLLLHCVLIASEGQQSKMQVAIQKLKLLASKLNKANCASLYQADVVSRQCRLACTRPRTQPTVPSNPVPIFEADKFKEIINCELRPKQISEDCARKIDLASLDKLGTEKVFFSKQKLSWFGAHKFCRKMGLLLGSMQTRQKTEQLLNLLRSPRMRQGAGGEVSSSVMSVWSSGCNLLRNSSRSFMWHDTLEPLSIDITSGLTNSKSDKGVLAHMSPLERQVKWEAVEFNARHFFFCEIPQLCFYQTCLPSTKNSAKIKQAKARFITDCLIGPVNKCYSCQSAKKKRNDASEPVAAVGRYMSFKKAKFFVSKVPKSPEDANEFCCKIQMTLWTPDNADEIHEMATTLYNNGYGNLSKPLLFTLNAREEKCDRKFLWCNKKKEVVGPEFPWGQFDPDDFLGNEVCLFFWLFPNRASPIITDEHCSGKKFFICQSDEKYADSQEIAINNAPYTFVEPPVKFEVLLLDCKNAPKCKPDGDPMPNTALGVVFKGAGKTYFLSNDIKSYGDGAKLCCSMGMHYATVESAEEANVIGAHLNNKSYTSIVDERVVFISKVYLNENNKTHWCATEAPVAGGSLASLPWMPGEPDNAYPAETILWFFNTRSRFGIGDGNIFAPWKILCQAPQK